MQNAGRNRVLVVDDSRDVRCLVARALKLRGLECDMAEDALAAEKMIRAIHYDVVISDLRMPHKSGHEFIVELLERNPRPAVVAITGVLNPRLAADLYERGVEDVTLKPISYHIFASKIKALARRGIPHRPPSGKTVEKSPTDEILETTSALKSDLAEITKGFHETISHLEEQRQELESGFIGVVHVLSNLANQGSQSHDSHARRVEEMAEAMAKRVSCSSVEVRDIRVAALLHEVGHFGMSDAIRMTAPATLSPQLRQEYEKYPLIAATLLGEISGSTTVVELIETHAENFDGSGFPHGRRGADIPLGARIIRIADGWDTFLMFAFGDTAEEKARRHLTTGRGQAYDPDLLPSAFHYIDELTLLAQKKKSLAVAPHDLNPGMVLAENVYDGEARFLVRRGATLTTDMIHRLQKIFNRSPAKVLVKDPPCVEIAGRK